MEKLFKLGTIKYNRFFSVFGAAESACQNNDSDKYEKLGNLLAFCYECGLEESDLKEIKKTFQRCEGYLKL